jgi:hypothetical protein
VQFVGVDAEGAAALDVIQVALRGQFVVGEIDGQALAHAADQGVDGQTGGFAGDVPEAVVEFAEPAGLLVDPAGAFEKHLVEPFAREGAFADGVGLEDCQLGFGDEGGGDAAGDAFVGFDFEDLHLHGCFGGPAGMGVLDAAQAGHLFEAVADLGEGWVFERVQLDVGDFHGVVSF